MKDIRSWAKSFVWRFIGVWLLGFISFLITHSWKETTMIIIIFHMLRVLMYYFHEAVWHKIPKKYDSKIFKLSLSLLILSFVLLISIEILKSL